MRRLAFSAGALLVLGACAAGLAWLAALVLNEYSSAVVPWLLVGALVIVWMVLAMALDVTKEAVVPDSSDDYGDAVRLLAGTSEG